MWEYLLWLVVYLDGYCQNAMQWKDLAAIKNCELRTGILFNNILCQYKVGHRKILQLKILMSRAGCSFVASPAATVLLYLVSDKLFIHCWLDGEKWNAILSSFARSQQDTVAFRVVEWCQLEQPHPSISRTPRSAPL